MLLDAIILDYLITVQKYFWQEKYFPRHFRRKFLRRPPKQARVMSLTRNSLHIRVYRKLLICIKNSTAECCECVLESCATRATKNSCQLTPHCSMKPERRKTAFSNKSFPLFKPPGWPSRKKTFVLNINAVISLFLWVMNFLWHTHSPDYDL